MSCLEPRGLALAGPVVEAWRQQAAAATLGLLLHPLLRAGHLRFLEYPAMNCHACPLVTAPADRHWRSLADVPVQQEPVEQASAAEQATQTSTRAQDLVAAVAEDHHEAADSFDSAVADCNPHRHLPHIQHSVVGAVVPGYRRLPPAYPGSRCS